MNIATDYVISYAVVQFVIILVVTTIWDWWGNKKVHPEHQELIGCFCLLPLLEVLMFMGIALMYFANWIGFVNNIFDAIACLIAPLVFFLIPIFSLDSENQKQKTKNS